MKIPDHARAPLIKKRPNRSTSKKSEFTLACEAAGWHPNTIRKRLASDPDLTLEQALAMPKMERSEIGRRSADKAWRKQRLEL